MVRRENPKYKVNIPGTCYLVGGAVRDQLMNLEVKERDWVVVGATVEEMLDARFIPVGKAFPVFLHPQTHEEYALARIETKTGEGHRGFSFQTSPDVTLEQDLRRRDLTVNAIARTDNDKFIDPFGGRVDLKKRQLRHVSAAFAEDPLRCFRVARFTAHLPEFHVHPGTLRLMAAMQGGLSTLSAERVWKEWSLAMKAEAPGRFYETIEAAKIQDPWFTGLKLSELAIEHRPLELGRSACFALVGWLHDVELMQEHFDRLKAPNKVKELVLNVSKFGQEIANIRNLTSERILEIFKLTNGFQKHSGLNSTIEHLSRLTKVDKRFVYKLQNELQRVKVEGEPGPELGLKIKEERLKIISELNSSWIERVDPDPVNSQSQEEQ